MKEVVQFARPMFVVGGTGRRVRAGWRYGLRGADTEGLHDTPVEASEVYDQVASSAGDLEIANVLPGAEPDFSAEKPTPAVQVVTPTPGAPVTRGVQVAPMVGRRRANPLADLSAAFEPGQIPWKKIGVAAALVALFNVVTA